MKNLAAETPLLILAGGKATRLRHLSADRPKYLQKVKDDLVFADIHLKWVAAKGFRRVILGIGHLGDQIRSYCADGTRWGLDISYIDDGALPLGTGGAVRAALDYPFTTLAVTYGDTVLSVDVPTFLSRFQEAKWAQSAMTLYRNAVPGHVCNADFNGERALYDKKHPPPSWAYIDYGFLALRREAIEGFPKDQTPLDLADPLSELANAGNVLGFEVTTRFWEIGSPEALAEFQNAFLSDFQTFLKL